MFATKKLDGKLKIICKILEENDFYMQAVTMRKLTVSNKLSDEHKIQLLKRKLDFIINSAKVRLDCL